ncbi:DUF1129 domain-containing protein [Periweissella fabalis]|uniref:DUF1129 family protein n=1 Tax=Periweissella fabalis TaxID=1070421 RepID=A0A7X6S2U6_9LACO|nr:hypothetical protein [Periweissella fabalis]MCM0599077.1 hypothetical protein [Periweissella fabalis]NKZ23357.1 hypothetical protein [Periweissella fabalis]
MRTSELIEKNNELRKLLNPENEQFYSDFLVYMRLKSFKQNEFKSETLLLEILNDILDAQDEGISAAQYFGKNPMQVADELLKVEPMSWREIIKLIGLVVENLLAFAFLPALVNPRATLDVGQFLLIAVYIIGLIVIGIKYLATMFYQAKQKITNKFLQLLLQLIAFVVVGLPVWGLFYLKTPWRFIFNGWLSIVVIVLVLLALTIWYVVFTNKETKLIYLPIYLFELVNGGLGILMRFDEIERLVFDTKNGRLLFGGGLFILLVLFWVIIHLQNRKNKNK